MAGEKSPAAMWCFLRSSQRLRAAVKWKIEKLNKPYGKIAEETGIPLYCISLYVHDRSRKGITQFNLLNLCKYLGIEVGLDIKFN